MSKNTMKSSNSSKENINDTAPKKKPYVKPEIITEELNVFGASCNGSTNGGRKSTTTSPNFCTANRLNS